MYRPRAPRRSRHAAWLGKIEGELSTRQEDMALVAERHALLITVPNWTKRQTDRYSTNSSTCHWRLAMASCQRS